MTYVEGVAMKILGEMSYNYGNKSEVIEIVNQIIADTKMACSIAVIEQLPKNFNLLGTCAIAINRAEVKERIDE